MSALPNRPSLRLVVSAAALVGVAASVLWMAGALDEVEWHDDFVTGVFVAAICLLHVVVGFAFPGRRTWLVVLGLWFLGTIGADILYFATSFDPYNTPRSEAEGCDPCIGPGFGFLFVVFALPLTMGGTWLRRLDHRALRRPTPP